MKPVTTLSRSEFVEIFGGIYEDSPWVAEMTWSEYGAPSSDDLEVLRQSMKEVVGNAPDLLQVALMRCHPDLAGKAALAGKLSEASTSEQAGAGLDQCTEEELVEFHKLNDQYKEKFGFPFIIAVGGMHRVEILESFRQRSGNSPETEFATGMAEIHKIAKLRFDRLQNE